ncbi:MAG TPA: hypothetical protein VEP90_14205 [Methylomirabilota bacterium]|nr:hypothetical protein [Methylomirabilota bacterium]
MLAILGAVAVAAWWTSLNKLVTKRVTKLYDKQKAEVDKTLDTQQQKIEVHIKSLQALLSPLEDKVKQSETRLETVNETLYDFEESITKSFAAMGPLLAEPVAQRAVGTKRFPTFPFYMTISYLDLIKQENKLSQLEQEIATYQESLKLIESRTSPNKDDLDIAARSVMESYKQTLSSYLDGFNSSSLLIALNLGDWHRTLYWWKAAKDNQPKTPSLKPEDFDKVQKEFDLYSTRMEKAEQDFGKLKSDAQFLLSRIENLLQ